MTQTQEAKLESSGGAGGDGGADGSQPRGSRRFRHVLVWGAAVVVIGAAVAAWLLSNGSSEPSSQSSKPATTLVAIERRDLVETDTESGTLGYTDERPVVFVQPGNAARGSGGSRPTASSSSSSTSAKQSRSGATLIDYSPSDLPSGSTGTTTEPATATLTIAPQGTGSGTITGQDPSGQKVIDCSWNGTSATGTCSAALAAGGVVTLHAEAAQGAALTSWTSCPGTIAPDGQTCTFSLTGDVTIQPVFTKTQQPPPSGGSGGGGGTQTPGSQPGGTGTPIADGTNGSGGSSLPQSSTPSASSPSGTDRAIVTWLPSEGQVVRRGEILFRVNGKATTLMYGNLPAWRALHQGMSDGADVRQLEQNLVALGYDPKRQLTVDNHFGAVTTAAVKRWQKAIGAPQTGKLKLGAVVFLPGPRIVGTLETEVGAELQAGATVMDTTSTAQNVTVDLDTTKQTLAGAGEHVTITLPSGDEVPGTIADVGRVVQSSSSDQSQPNSDSSGSTITVTITLDRKSGVEFDQAPVDVDFAQETRRDVLVVPVTALLSLLGGGYAVEVSDGTGHTHLVRVTPGLYADGYVEVAGDGIAEGTKVVVPQ
jgi:hypothetical protein